MGKFWRWLAGVPRLLMALTIFQEDVAERLRDPKIQRSWDRFPRDAGVAGHWPHLAEEWRAVEEAAVCLRS
jgi:hypothetical protein